MQTQFTVLFFLCVFSILWIDLLGLMLMSKYIQQSVSVKQHENKSQETCILWELYPYNLWQGIALFCPKFQCGFILEPCSNFSTWISI